MRFPVIKAMKYAILLTFFLAGFTNAQENEPEYIPGELIVQFIPGVNPEVFTDSFSPVALNVMKPLSRRMNIWLIGFTPAEGMADRDVLDAVNSHEDVVVAQFNHKIELRSAPNDPFFGNQWALNNTGQSGGTPDADIDALEAWDFAPDGMTSTGEQIVVAIIDDGFDLEHEDLDYFRNVHEIPGNGVDDDNNGYIDDYVGWNAFNSNGTLPVEDHGQHVTGIAGAVGNNGIGVSGVNRGVKILPVAGASGNEATVVEAYGYVLEMRIRYDQTSGSEGAFVVATNSSFGVAGSPASFPIWCSMYDTLGMAGMVNATATANANIDIDLNPDIPTSCASDYMISVTNTTRNDAKNTSPGAAFGATTVDLGSPGTVILSTLPGNNYGSNGWTGTSMAAPHVASSVSLLIAAAPVSFIAQYKSDPAGTALDLKDYILNGTDPIADLQGKSVTGGRLNAFNSILLMMSDEDDPRPPTNIAGFSDYQTPSTVSLSWTDPTELVNGNPIGAFAVRLYRNGSFLTEVTAGTLNYADLGLSDGTKYIYEFRARLLSNDSLSAATKTVVYAGGSPFPAAPRNLECTGTLTGADLIWDKVRTQSDGTFLDDLAKYYIYRDGVLVDSTTSGNDTTYTDTPPVLQQTYTYTVRAVDNESPPHRSEPSNESSCFVGPPLSLHEDGNVLPRQVVLYQNYPNPFNPSTRIEFLLPENSDVSLAVYNILGERVAVLAERALRAGSHSITWDGTNDSGRLVGSGLYIYRLVAGGKTFSKKMLLVR